MIKNFTTLFLLFLINAYSFSFSQTITSSLLDLKSRQPIQGVKVFYDQSTISTFTDQNGIFELPEIQLIPNPKLVYYHPDYQIYEVADIAAIDYIYYLKPKKERSQTSNSSSGIFNIEEMYALFRTNFIGTTKNAKKTRILNEEVLQMRYDTLSYKFYAKASKPLQIQNDALGYSIEYYLKDFQMDFSADTLEQDFVDFSFFYGYSLFKDIDNTKEKQRQKAFDGTLKHFFKQIVTGAYDKIKSKVIVEKRQMKLKKLFDVQHINPNRYKLNLNRDYVNYNEDDDFTFYIQTNHREKGNRTYYFNLDGNPYHINKGNRVTLYKPYLLVDGYGNLLEEDHYEVSGEILEIDLADRLPLDYITE